MSTEAPNSLSFEEALSQLETLVERMEKGDLGLEESLSSYKEGVRLHRQCFDMLKNAEQQVETLTQPDAEADLQPLEHD